MLKNIRLFVKRDRLRQYDSVIRWGNRVQLQGSQYSCLDTFLTWYSDKHGKTTPDQLIEIQLGLENGERYKLLDEIQLWVNSHKGRQGTKRVKYSQIRSFFSHNRAELPRDPGFRIISDVPAVVGSLTPEEIKRILLTSNKLYRAVFISIFQAGLDGAMFVYWNENGWNELREQLIKGSNPIKINLPGRKLNRNIKPYYSYISGDAINAIRDYLPDPLPLNRDYIFNNQAGTGISKQTLRNYFRRHLKKLGMIKQYDTGNKQVQVRYGKNPHEMRDTFRTLWSMSPARYEVGEYFMGHIVDKLGYDKSSRDPDFYRKEYTKASRFLNLLSSNAPYGLVESDKVEDLRLEVNRLESEKTDELTAMKTKLESEIAEMKKQQDELMKLLYKHLPRE